jgi:hypothetical protein
LERERRIELKESSIARISSIEIPPAVELSKTQCQKVNIVNQGIESVPAMSNIETMFFESSPSGHPFPGHDTVSLIPLTRVSHKQVPFAVALK